MTCMRACKRACDLQAACVRRPVRLSLQGKTLQQAPSRLTNAKPIRNYGRAKAPENPRKTEKIGQNRSKIHVRGYGQKVGQKIGQNTCFPVSTCFLN